MNEHDVIRVLGFPDVIISPSGENKCEACNKKRLCEIKKKDFEIVTACRWYLKGEIKDGNS